MRHWLLVLLLLSLVSIVGLAMGLSFAWSPPTPGSLDSTAVFVSTSSSASVSTSSFVALTPSPANVISVDPPSNDSEAETKIPSPVPSWDVSEWFECVILVGNARMPVWLESHALPVHRVNDTMGQLTALSAAVVHDQNALVVLEDFTHELSLEQLEEFFARVRREHANFWHVLVLESQTNFRLQTIPTRLGAYIVHRHYHSQLLSLLFEQCVDCETNMFIEQDVWLAVQNEPEPEPQGMLAMRPHVMVTSEDERRLVALYHPQAFVYYFLVQTVAPGRSHHHRTLSRQHLTGVTYVWDESQWQKLVSSRHINQCFRCTVSGELVSIGENVVESVALFLGSNTKERKRE